MPLLGQASGGFTESSSALRLLNVGIRNSVGVLTDDSFTQTNPPVISTDVSAQVDQLAAGVLSGSVAFTRPAPSGGSNLIGGPGSQAVLDDYKVAVTPLATVGFRALGCFINSANGNAFENTPGTASGKGPYVSAQGTFGNALFETAQFATSAGGGIGTGTALVYGTGMALMASINGYIMPTENITGGGAVESLDDATIGAESHVREADGAATVLGVVKMPPDAVMNEVVYDQRI